jgi:hypothetical protein
MTKTELVFKLEGEPNGYGQKFAPNCKVDIKADNGFVYLDYNNKYLMGAFQNLRQEGEVLLADITLFEHHEVISHRLEYSIAGSMKKNDDGECTHLTVTGVGALMPPKD